MIWQRRLAHIYPELNLTVVGTDLSDKKIEAARHGQYPKHSVQGLPSDWQVAFFQVPEAYAAVSVSSGYSKSQLILPGIVPDPDWHVRRQTKKTIEKLERSRAVAAIAALPGGPRASRQEGDWLWRLCDSGVRENVSFEQQDVTKEMPDGPFDVILSRYAVCLYLEGEQKIDTLSRMVGQLREGGFLVVGAKDKLPLGFCERHGLKPFSYRTATDAAPFGPSALVDGIFRKQVDFDGAEASSCSDASPRKRASSYGIFLNASGGVPDWKLERDKLFKERTQRKLTTRSRALLERRALRLKEREAENASPVSDGSSVGISNCMVQDYCGRREASVPARPMTSISKEDAAVKLRSFFSRLGQDMEHRATTARAAEKESDGPLPPLARSRKGSSRRKGSRSKSLPNGIRSQPVLQTAAKPRALKTM
jgi:hypothetical protein